MRYSGKLGLAQQTETSPGVWENVITERDVLGTIEQRSEVFGNDNSILPRYRTTTSISLLSRGVWAQDNVDIAYVTWRGRYWVPSSVVEEFPEITIYIGEEYHGPKPAGP